MLGTPTDRSPMSLPPLVAPGPDLTAAQRTRFSRHLLVPGIGVLGQRRLLAARVLVVGAGGLGAPVVQYLAAAGVGTIGIVDDDQVEVSNLQRQVVHGVADLGRAKVDSAADAVRRIDPATVVRAHPVRLDSTNALELLAGYDLVIDGTDNFPTRYLVADACELLGLPAVWGAILRFDGQVAVFWTDPPPGGHPAVGYRDVFPEPPAAGAVPSCAEAGVLGAVCGAVGSMMAIEAVKLIVGAGEPVLGRMQVLDAWSGRWRELPILPDPGRTPVTALAEQGQVCAVPAPVPTLDASELAARLAARDRGADDFDLVDVRSAAEHELVAIPGARLVPLDEFRSGAAWASIDPDRELVLYCKAGSRSAQAGELARDRGLRVSHLAGGVLSWVDQVSPASPRY